MASSVASQALDGSEQWAAKIIAGFKPLKIVSRCGVKAWKLDLRKAYYCSKLETIRTSSTIKAKGLRFVGKNKAVIDVSRHGSIMEDAIDRIIAKEARQEATSDWEAVKAKLDKKHGLGDVQNTPDKKSRKKPGKS